MSNANQKTIQVYDAHVDEYIASTPHQVVGVVKEWLDEALADLPKDATILEIGSAFGRDAAYMQNLGYTVQCSDASKSFVELLQQKGLNVMKLNVITDDLGGPYDLVLANAVLLHFTRADTRRVLQKVFRSLKDGGRFAFTLKQGEGYEWRGNKGAPRYFCYWTEEQLKRLLKSIGLTDVTIKADQVTAHSIWLQVIAVKKHS
jgi:SAM-dependent methyltransferase